MPLMRALEQAETPTITAVSSKKVPRMFFPNTTSNYKGALLQDELRGPLPGFAGNEFGPLGVSFWQSAAIFGYPRQAAPFGRPTIPDFSRRVGN
jgi:hypothetical protein